MNAHAIRHDNPHAVTAAQVGAGGGGVGIDAHTRGVRFDGSTDNTVLLQSLLDEVSREGGGKVIFAAGQGSQVNTRGLWVASNTHIVIEPGVKIYGTAPSTDARSDSGDDDRIYASGVFTCLGWTVGYSDRACTDVIIEGGGTIGTASDRMTGFILGCRSTRIRDLYIDGPFYDAIYITGRGAYQSECRDIWIERVEATFAQRNCVSLVLGEYIWFNDCTFRGATAVVSNPDAPSGERTGSPTNPGCGIELEPGSNSDDITNIFINRCILRENKGAGLGLILGNNGESDNSGEVFATGNIIRDNGGAAGTQGQIQVQYGAGGKPVEISGGTCEGQLLVRSDTYCDVHVHGVRGVDVQNDGAQGQVITDNNW